MSPAGVGLRAVLAPRSWSRITEGLSACPSVHRVAVTRAVCWGPGDTANRSSGKAKWRSAPSEEPWPAGIWGRDGA